MIFYVLNILLFKEMMSLSLQTIITTITHGNLFSKLKES